MWRQLDGTRASTGNRSHHHSSRCRYPDRHSWFVQENTLGVALTMSGRQAFRLAPGRDYRRVNRCQGISVPKGCDCGT